MPPLPNSTRARRAALLFAGVFAALALSFSGCVLLTTYDGYGCENGSCTDAGTQDAADAAPDTTPPDPCSHARWPAPPDASDLQGQLTVFAAAQEVSAFGDADGGSDGGLQANGYDLDGVCTCPGPDSCINAGRDAAACDEPGTGRDNGFRKSFGALKVFGLGLDDTGLNTGLKKGDYGIIFRLDRYDGAANDPDVSLAIYSAVGLVDDGGAPRGDGTDTWTIDTESIRGGLALVPNYLDDHAYVSNHVLVASLDVVLNVIFYQGTVPVVVPIDVRGARVTATLREVSPGAFAMDEGVINGRVPETALFKLGAALGGCPGVPSYEAFKPLFCDSLDIHQAAGAANGPCDAVSTVFAFHAVPANVKGSATRPPVTPLCTTVGSCK